MATANAVKPDQVHMQDMRVTRRIWFVFNHSVLIILTAIMGFPVFG